MASSKLKLFRSPLPPAIAERGLPIKQPTATATKRAFLLFQMKSEQVQILQAPKTITVSRRDIIQYAATKSLVGFALLFTEPAEARVGRLENKKKAMEKLREKSRVSKPKGEAPPAQQSPDDKSLPTFPPPPQGSRVARLVEATHNNI